MTAGGSEAAETLVGTDEEDFLAGLGGDDLFPESGGRDGINGGEGTDTYRLVGPRAEYIIVPEGDGRRVTGANGSAYLVNVERLVFADGEALSLADQ